MTRNFYNHTEEKRKIICSNQAITTKTRKSFKILNQSSSPRWTLYELHRLKNLKRRSIQLVSNSNLVNSLSVMQIFGHSPTICGRNAREVTLSHMILFFVYILFQKKKDNTIINRNYKPIPV